MNESNIDDVDILSAALGQSGLSREFLEIQEQDIDSLVIVTEAENNNDNSAVNIPEITVAEPEVENEDCICDELSEKLEKKDSIIYEQENRIQQQRNETKVMKSELLNSRQIIDELNNKINELENIHVKKQKADKKEFDNENKKLKIDLCKYKELYEKSECDLVDIKRTNGNLNEMIENLKRIVEGNITQEIHQTENAENLVPTTTIESNPNEIDTANEDENDQFTLYLSNMNADVKKMT